MSDSVELKPCPFCGNIPERRVSSGILSVHCNECVSVGFHHHVRFGCRADEEWNTRATDPLLDEMAEALARYRNETPLGHQPHMIAHKVDEMLQKYREHQSLTHPNPQPPQP